MNQSQTTGAHGTDPALTLKLVLAWLWVGIPLLWGVGVTLQNAAKLFTS